MSKAVERGLLHRDAVELLHLSVNEKSYGRGNKFITLLMDLKRCMVHATAEVWAQKEWLRRPRSDTSVRDARWHFTLWVKLVRTAGCKRVITVADLIESRLVEVISSYRYPISNSHMEGMNSIIMIIQRAGRGYRHAEKFGTAIMVICGGLQLSP